MHLRKPVTYILILIAVVEVVLPLLMFLGRNKLIFLPSTLPSPEDALGELGALDARLVRIRRPDGRELAAYDAAPRGDAGRARPVVLFLHGNAGNVAQRAPLLAWFTTVTDSRVLLLDYSGYGGNAGSASEHEINVDALAAQDWLVVHGVPASRIIVYGESIGCAPALVVATQRDVAGVVLQAPMSSLSSMARHLYPWLPLVSLLASGDFPNAKRAAAVDVPLLVVHGTEDEIVPFTEGQKLHATAGAGAELMPVEGAGHNDLIQVGGVRYLRDLGERFRGWTR
ncbi:MAG: alpha/beta fold hydrolase [Planctomycetota bacterium]